MSESIQSRILSHLQSESYQPAKPRRVARELELHQEDNYHAFRDAVRALMDQGRVMAGDGGTLVIASSHQPRNQFLGTYSQNRRGFGFVAPLDADAKEDIFIPPGEAMGALTGDKVRIRLIERDRKGGSGVGGGAAGGARGLFTGRVVEIIERANSRFAGELVKQGSRWYVLPDGNRLTHPIAVPDAASRHVRPGTKVVVEITEYPEMDYSGRPMGEPKGVITEVLGEAGEKDVDLKSVIIAHNLPEAFPDAVLENARAAVTNFDVEAEKARRLDLTKELILTIDPDDAKDYDDAISLRRAEDGLLELGVHIADVSHFVKVGSALDEEAAQRGNSTYFPGHVIPMLPEILSNGVCSLQEGVPRFCLSAFIALDEDAKPVRTWFAETVIKSSKRLRYREAQDLIDGSDSVFHPEGNRTPADYDPKVIRLLNDLDHLAKKIQKRRHAAGQLVLDLPTIELKLDQDGKVVGTAKEDTSFTHTLIEMFMVEANEAVARLFHSLDIPFLRRIHPHPDPDGSARLNQFVTVAGHRLPKEFDRKAIQKLVMSVRGKPESYAINLAVLKSLARAEYSPEVDGHYALASEHYSHFTSPIRRYADLMIHRLLRQYLEERGGHTGKKKARMEGIPSFDDLVLQGRHISFTERRSEDAERELRQVKVLALLAGKVGQDFPGVVTGIANFGIYIQLSEYLIEGLIRYEDLMDDWWDVDAKAGMIRGKRTGRRIGIGDTVLARIARVDPARRELSLSITKLESRITRTDPPPVPSSIDDSPSSNRDGRESRDSDTPRKGRRPSFPKSSGKKSPGGKPSTKTFGGFLRGVTPPGTSTPDSRPGKKSGKRKSKFKSGPNSPSSRPKSRNKGRGRR